MKKVLMLLRGVSGCGKSTLALFLNERICSSSFHEADKWMKNDKEEYQFNATKLGYCHNSCKMAVEQDMIKGFSLIIVSNTSSTVKELNPYIDLAKQYGY